MVKVFIIAEAGVNHDGRLHKALQLVDAAKAAGADAVKFQTFDAKRLASAGAPKAKYQKRSSHDQESQLGMLKALQLSESDHRALKKYCLRKGIEFMSTPFDEQSADFLNTLGVKRFKIPSGELTNIGFVRHVGAFGKPMIVSTGMASLAEVKTAVSALRKTGNKDLTLLHCVSNYPTDPTDVNLKAMQTLAEIFKVPVGFSDHTLGIDIAVAAVAMGAVVVEKHLTLDKKSNGPDHSMSLEVPEFKRMVDAIRRVSVALGSGIKKPAKAELAIAKVARKSLVAARSIKSGEVLTKAMITVKRPGTGLAPEYLSELIGRRAKRSIVQDQLILKGMVV